MFKAIKYLLLANLFKKAKKSFIILFVSVAALILISFIINDLMSVTTGAIVYILLFVKWVSIILLLCLIAINLLKIFNIATNPFEATKQDESSENNEIKVSQGLKKERILSKKKLFTQSDLIVQKYIKD